MPNAIIFDIEATDKDNPVLIEAAWVALDSISPFTLGEEFHQRYNPGKPISLGALATHHILDEELVDCPPASSFTLPADATYLIGHNIDFDWNAIGQPDIKLLKNYERELRKLFVGFTRAQYKVVCLISERAEAILMGRV